MATYDQGYHAAETRADFGYRVRVASHVGDIMPRACYTYNITSSADRHAETAAVAAEHSNVHGGSQHSPGANANIPSADPAAYTLLGAA